MGEFLQACVLVLSCYIIARYAGIPGQVIVGLVIAFLVMHVIGDK